MKLDEVRAELKPEQKVAAIRELSAAGQRVAMIGDGVNDAPSLAAAHIGVAMGARGADAALEQADVVLMHDRLENFLAAFRLSQRARRVIRQNLFISLGTVVVLVTFALLGKIPLTDRRGRARRQHGRRGDEQPAAVVGRGEEDGGSRMTPEDFMREAIRLSRDSIEKRAGGRLVRWWSAGAKSWGGAANQVTAANDPTAHAEITAIRQACKQLQTFRLDECELYSSCEPCPMCLAAIYWAGLTRVYYGNNLRDAAKIAFRDSLIYRELARPMARRQIPMQPLLRAEALKTFAEWKNKPDKIEY